RASFRGRPHLGRAHRRARRPLPCRRAARRSARTSRMRIVRLANFVTPRSGGLRTALRELGRGFLAAGHEPILIVPGGHASDEETSQGRVITVPGPKIKMIGGYRVMLDRSTIRTLLDRLKPDSIEVSDRSTLRWTGAWARRRGIPSVMVSHE